MGDLYRPVDYAVLRCGCSVREAEFLHSSAVGAAQLAHATDESICVMRPVPELLWAILYFTWQFGVVVATFVA